MSLNSSANTSNIDSIIGHEDGDLDAIETIEHFQELIDSGQAWRMQGSVGRQAMAMIRGGQCLLGPVGHHDAYGNYVPSRDEVQPGTPGSQEYVLNSLAS